jgi:hypothetical protein
MLEIKEGRQQALCREARQLPCIARHSYRFVSDLSLICNEKGIDTVALIADSKALLPMGWPPFVLFHRHPDWQLSLFRRGRLQRQYELLGRYIGPRGMM